MSFDFAFRTGVFTYLFYILLQIKDFETEEASKKIKKKTKEEKMKQLKESIMCDENVNKDIKESARNNKNSG